MSFNWITRLNIYVIPITTLLACGSIDSTLQSSAPNPEPLPPASLEPEFIYSGLDGHIVERLISTTDYLLAATDQGLHRLDAAGNWQLLTQADWYILDAAVINDHHLLISAKSRGDVVLVESTDGGQTWEFLQHDFGGAESTEREPIHRLYYDSSTRKLYGVGYDVLAESTDLGRQWHILYGQWFGFARGLWALNLHDVKGDIWYGGQGAIENPVLRRFIPTNLAMRSYPQIDELLQKPSTVRNIRFHPDKPELVYISGEGGLIQSADYGETWQDLHTNDEYRFYFDLLLDPTDPHILYTAGWNKKFDVPQLLLLEISRDGGQTWQQYTYGNLSFFGGVYSMAWHQSNGHNRLYLGLYKGGVMEVLFNSPQISSGQTLSR